MFVFNIFMYNASKSNSNKLYIYIYIIIVVIIVTPGEFFTPELVMVSNWSLRDNKSPKISRTLFVILADFYNAVFWMVYIYPLISKFSSSFTNPMEIVPSAPITIGITVTFMSHSYFQFSSKVKIFISLFGFFYFHCVPPGRQSPPFTRLSLFLFLSFLCDYQWPSG